MDGLVLQGEFGFLGHLFWEGAFPVRKGFLYVGERTTNRGWTGAGPRRSGGFLIRFVLSLLAAWNMHA